MKRHSSHETPSQAINHDCANASEQLARRMLDAAPFGAVVFASDRELIMANKAMYKGLGLSSEEECVRNFFDFSPELQPDGSPSKEKAREYIQTAFQNGSQHFEWVYKKKDGGLIPSEVVLERVNHNGGHIVAGYVRDMRNELSMQEEIRKASEEKNTLTNIINILNGLHTIIYVTDPETNEILFLNDYMKKHFNFEEDHIGERCYTVLYKREDKRCEDCPCHILDRNPDEVIEWDDYNLITNRFYRNIGRYIEWFNGKKVHLNYSVDITEQRTMLTKLDLAMSGTKVALWDLELTPEDPLNMNNRHNFSDAFRKMLGYNDENDFPSLVGSVLNNTHPDDAALISKSFWGHINDKTGKTPYDVEYRLMKSDGEYGYFRSVGQTIRNAEGVPILLAGTLIDINDSKKMQEDLVESHEYIRTMFENAPIGLNIFDENYKFIDCNDAVLSMFGVTKEFFRDYFGSAAHSPEFQPDGMNSLEKALELTKRVMNGEDIKLEWIHRKPNGELLPVEITTTRVKRNDEYVGFCYMYDMREQIRLKQELETALRKAQDADRAKSAFLANMSHEIRTPMNAIMGIAEIQLRDGGLSQEMTEALSRIYDSGNLLLNIVNDILDLSKIEAGKLEIIPTHYDVPSLVNDTVQLNRLRYDSKALSFQLKIDEKTPLNLFGDELRIKQILNNVLSNAFKYTDDGLVRMSVWHEPVENDEEQVIMVFRVIDTGQGMTPEQLDNLFKEYTRFNLEANRTTVGTGLGMSITKRLVDLLNGDIAVISDVGWGTSMTVRIPQTRTDSLVCGPDLAEKLRNFRFESTARNKKNQITREHMPYGSVLIVDDVESNIYVTRGMLLPYGLKIDTAVSGFEAVEKVKAGNVYDIIFMDHMMPKMDGIQATKIIRELGYHHTVVALTANALVGQAEMFLKNGFDGFISKPIDSRELNAALNEFIRNKKPTDVVEKARREQEAMNRREAAIKAQAEGNKAKLEDLFLKDVENAIEVLKDFLTKLPNPEPEDIELYTITVHGMKSAARIINENALSDFALRLEQASKEKNMPVMINETSRFIDDLQSIAGGMKNSS